MPPTTRVYHCGLCGRKLRPDRWVFSVWTKNRYCRPGEGCQKVRR